MAVPGLTAPIPGLLTARYAGGSLMIGGTDILAGLVLAASGQSVSVISFSYADNTSDMADDLTVEIGDPNRTWLQTFVPVKGSECNAIIKVRNWYAPGDDQEFDCGVMWVDELSLAGPPNMVTVKASSVPLGTGFKNQKQYEFWENQPLMTIAAQIATNYGLQTVWDTAKNPTFRRTDIGDMSHLEYLRDKCKREGLSLKIFNRQLVVYSEEEYEARPSVYTITYGASQIKSYEFVNRLNDTYAKATNGYVSPITGKYINGEFVPPFAPEGQEAELHMNERVEDDAEGEGLAEGPFRAAPREDLLDTIDYSSQNAAAAEAARGTAKHKLRSKNKREKEAIITVFGNPSYLSGLCTDLVGFGNFDGKWFISSTIHSISENGYTTELRMRAALQGY